MKIIITSTGPQLESEVDPRFGRCAWFVVVDTESREVDAIENPAAGGSSGAGVGASRAVVKADAEAVITGQVGPNAAHALNELGVRMYTTQATTVAQALDEFIAGECREIDRANVPSHAGFGMAAPNRPQANPPQDTGQLPGSGLGGGLAGGTGGAGAGRGRGQGQGRRGGGGGRGRGRS